MRSKQIQKQIVFVASAAALLVATPSQASKSRLTALQFADFWRDTQTVFLYPQYASSLGQYATLEFGPTGTFSTEPHAEGGFAKKVDGGILGVYLGHQNATLNTVYTAASVGEQNNPFYVYYAKGDTGFGLNFSYSDTKSTTSKELSVGPTFGTKLGEWELGSSATIYSKSETGATSAKALPEINVQVNRPVIGGVWFYAGGNYVRTDVTGTTESGYGFRAGAQDHSTKIASGTFFYGAEASYAKLGTAKTFRLPVYGGIETDIFSWAQIRGSISQSLINHQKTTAAGSADINSNDTVVSLGSTVKTGQFSLDGLLAAGTSGQVNGTSFLTSASLTYKF